MEVAKVLGDFEAYPGFRHFEGIGGFRRVWFV
jgi:hypothetical protein